MDGKLSKDLLQKVAFGLGGNWRYHAILTEEKKYHGHFLSNGAGLFINVRNDDKIPLWTLQFKHPKHNTLQNIVTRGCSITKPLESITSDLKARLLTHTTLAYEKLEKLTREVQESQNKVLNEKHFLDAMSKVFYLEGVYDHRYMSSFRIGDSEGIRYATMRKGYSMEKLSLEIDDVTPEQIFQIMKIVAPNIFKK